MFLSVLLKSFSQIAQKSRRRPVGAVAILTERCEERRLLSAVTRMSSEIPNAPLGGSTGGGQLGTPLPLTNLPLLNSLPGAPVSVILKFDGYTDSDPGWVSFRDSGSGPIVTPAFDLDNDATTFNAEELRQIEEIWYRVAEDFSPLNINVTTIAPAALNDFEHVMVIIGGDGDWAPPAGGWGAIDGFSTSGANTNYVFSESFFSAQQIASASSHESGHTLGLQHQSTYDANGTKVAEYNPGDVNLAPLMGNGYDKVRDTWWLGPNSTSSTTIQDDLVQLTKSQNRTVRFRTDDHGNSIPTASSIVVSAADISASGVIERNDDSDFFEVVTDDGPISFSVEGLNLRSIYNMPTLNFGTNLDVVLRLYDSSGTLLDSSNSSGSLFGSVSATVTAGKYYVEVTHTGQYGAIGQFNLTGTVNPLETFSLTVNPTTVVENDGARAAIGTVERSIFANLANPIVVTLTSTDTSEITLPATVTIAAGSRSASFPINAMDDRLADGTQHVDITAEAVIAGELRTASAWLNVEDYEALTMVVDPTTVLENAGNGAVRVTITRSNVDTLPPNTFAVVNNQLREYNYLGALVRTRTIPWPTGTRPAGETARDAVVMEDNRIAVFNGTTQAVLSVLNQVTNTWQHIPVPELSTESAIAGTGGISTVGNYVFLTDTKEAATEDNGIVRVDVNTGLVTRFGTRSPGYRLFVKDIFTESIFEVSPTTGATLNTIPMPPNIASNFGFNNGLAFDGTALWVLAGPIGNDQVYEIDPDTGAVLDVHTIPVPTTGEWDGLASLNGLLYLQSSSGSISVYSPFQRGVIDVLDVNAINGITVTGGLAGITGPNRLLTTNSSTGVIYEINPFSGIVVSSFSSGLSSVYGLATANSEIYVGGFQAGQLRVFNRSGFLQRFVNITVAQPEGVFALGGDNVLSLVDTTLRYRDVYAGLDNKLYAVDVNGSTVGRFNATTLANETFITLASPVNALAAAADGTLWGAGANGVLYHFSSTGVVLSQTQIGNSSLVDIDLNVVGQILLTSINGILYRTNTAGAVPTTVNVGSTVAFASFGRHQSLSSTGEVTVQLTNSDPTAIRLPSSVVIPVGRRFVTILADVVDDDVVDGTQFSIITASAMEYIGTQTATVTVLDAETVGIDIIAGSISEAAGPAATMARIYRTDTDGPFTYLSTQSYSNNSSQTILDADKTTSRITVPTQTSRLLDVNVTLSLNHAFLADLDIFLVSPSGTRVELVTDLVSNEPLMTSTTFDDAARSGILTGTTPFTGRFLPEGELLDMNGENPNGVWTLEITDDNQKHFGTLLSWSLDIQTVGLEAMTVALNPTGNPNEIRAQQFVTIPANQSEITVPVDAVDDNILDGTQVAGLRASSAETGYLFGSDSVSVRDQETLLFTVSSSSVSEAAGTGSLTGTLTRQNSDIGVPFTVSLFTSDASELRLPATVTIPANQRSVSFDIQVVDDALLDGSQIVVLRANAPAYGSDKTQSVTVTDLEPSLQISADNISVREDAGSFFVTVIRQDQTDISRAMLVSLSVSSFSGAAVPLTVPAFVTIPANETQKTFQVQVNDDRLLDGTQTARIRATANGIISGATNFAVTDHETLTVTVNKSSIREDAGVRAARGTVQRSNTNTASALAVRLTSSDISELTVPITVIIPAGATSASFDINAINDPELDGTHSVTISAAATNYFGGSVNVNVLDHEPPVVTGPTATVVNPLPVVTWNAVPNALRYDVLLINRSTGVQQLYPSIPETRFVPRERLGIGQYSAFVRAVDQLERAGFWSLARDFKVETAPTLTAPGITGSIVGGTFPEISWTAVIDAAGYELVVNNMTSGGTRVISRDDLTTTSYRATEVLGSATYKAQVRAFNASGEYGQWSSALYFSVLAAPGIVTPVTGGTFERTPVIRWNTIAGATTYDVQVTNLDTNKVIFRDRSVPGISTRVPNDLPDANYRVEVRAQSGRYFSVWSQSVMFSVGASPAITSPASGENAGSQPKFVWTGISGTERYELWVRNQVSLVWVVQANNVTETNFTPDTKLPLGEYRVFVRAVSTLGEKTDWSAPVDFIGGDTPSITTPVADATTSRRPLFSWSLVAGASRYNLWIKNLDTNQWAITLNNLTSNTYTATTNLSAGKYRVWVRAVSAAGAVSAWSETVDFRVAGVAGEQLSPDTNSGNLLATLFSPDSQASILSLSESEMEGQPSVSVADRRSSVSAEDESAHDAVMAGWDHSEWWTERGQSAEGAV